MSAEIKKALATDPIGFQAHLAQKLCNSTLGLLEQNGLHGLTARDWMTIAEAAMEALASLPPEGAGEAEPVAWRYRVAWSDGRRGEWKLQLTRPVEGHLYDTQPLYAHPSPDAGRLEELERLREALTPSAETKADYIGEFSFSFPSYGPDGEEVTFTPNVPWTTIKEIMAAIRARAAREPDAEAEAK